MDSQFDELAALYEEMAEWPFRKHCEIPSVFSVLGDLSGLDVFDFGCGSGFYSRALRQRGAASVTGYDESEGMIAYARRREEKEQIGVSFIDTLDETTEQHFDLLLSVYVLPYASDFPALLDMCGAMVSRLKPGGRLVALPIHPEYALPPSYYRHYGFQLSSDEQTAYDDGSAITLHLCHPPYDEYVTAYYWSAQALHEAMTKQGLEALQWHQPRATEEGLNLLGAPFWEAYQSRPHAAILEGRKER
ncbi:class I SAM-dependent methyltransferase [Alloalcanivorax dieselolei]|nr:class I SAM-dependent methyltransferase [Alloalcanivorax dieselolei]